MEWVCKILDRFPDKEAASSGLAVLSTVDGRLLRLFGDELSARQAIAALAKPLPLSVLPIGETDDGLIVLDLCAVALERGVLPVLRLCQGGVFFESISPSLAVWAQARPNSLDDSRSHPTSFAVHADHALSEPSDSFGVAALWANVFQRPLYTARSWDQICTVQAGMIAAGEHVGADPLALRLARCGLDAEQWRVVGAERAVANRVRCALRAMEGALFLGASRAMVAKVVERMYRAHGLAVGISLLAWHQQK